MIRDEDVLLYYDGEQLIRHEGRLWLHSLQPWWFICVRDTGELTDDLSNLKELFRDAGEWWVAEFKGDSFGELTKTESPGLWVGDDWLDKP